MTRKLFIYGHPGLYGGAATELHHQIMVWKEIGIDLHIIPSMTGVENEPLYQEMINIGVTYHNHNDFSSIEPEDAIINFCSKEFLEALPEIKKRTSKTIFVNCMTWIFSNRAVNYEKNEEWNHASGNIGFSLYQRPQVLEAHQDFLKSKGSTAKFLHFKAYYHQKEEFSPNRDFDKFTLGRISRQDQDKFTKNLWHIWEYIVSPKFKRGIALGWDHRSEAKCGRPHSWIETYLNHTKLPVSEFWKSINVIVQPTETNENWPRIGFEAMYSGVPLIVDNRAGWQHMIDHGKTGFLCNNEREFIYWGSRMAFEPSFREDTARRAYAKALELSCMEVSKASWEEVFSKFMKVEYEAPEVYAFEWDYPMSKNEKVILIHGEGRYRIREIIEARYGIQYNTDILNYGGRLEIFRKNNTVDYAVLLPFKWTGESKQIAILTHELIHLVIAHFKEENIHGIPSIQNKENDEELLCRDVEFWMFNFIEQLNNKEKQPYIFSNERIIKSSKPNRRRVRQSKKDASR